MKRLYIYIVAIFLVGISINCANGQTAGFLDVNPDARVMGMANTGVVANATAYSIWNNGASALFSDKKMEVSAGYTSWQPDYSGNTLISAAGYGKVSERINIVAGVKYFTHKDYDIIDDSGNSNGTFKPKEFAVGVGLGLKIIPILSASINVNYISSDMGTPKKGNAVAADLGLMLKLKYINVGLTAANIGSKVDYGGIDKYKLPANIKLGVGTSLGDEVNKVNLQLQGCMTLQESTFALSVGGEYIFKGILSARAGYHYGDEKKYIPSYASVGLGVNLFGFSINGSYLIAGSDSPIKNSLMATLAWGF